MHHISSTSYRVAQRTSALLLHIGALEHCRCIIKTSQGWRLLQPRHDLLKPQEKVPVWGDMENLRNGVVASYSENKPLRSRNIWTIKCCLNRKIRSSSSEIRWKITATLWNGRLQWWLMCDACDLRSTAVDLSLDNCALGGVPRNMLRPATAHKWLPKRGGWKYRNVGKSGGASFKLQRNGYEPSSALRNEPLRLPPRRFCIHNEK